MNWIFLATLLQDKVISGKTDIEYVFRDGAVQRVRSALNGGSGGSSEEFFFGRATVRLDWSIGTEVSGVVELETPSFDGGADLRWGSNPESARIAFEQAYVEIAEVLTSKLSLRAGIQDFAFRLRPHGEPFFLDASESESFYSGAAGFVRNTADRDVLEPVGVDLRYAVADFMGVELFWATMIEGGATSEDETLYGAFLNGILSERISYYLFAGLVSGAGPDRNVWTIGLGFDWYPSRSRSLELFTEIYIQFGTLTPEDDIFAWALLIGGRVYGVKGWVEGAFTVRSGDDGFQSYENVNQFVIVESAAWGWDIDSNILSPRLAAGYAFAERVEGRIDIGYFRFPEEVRTAAGSILTSARDLGVEIDLAMTWSLSTQVRLRLRGAALIGSRFSDALTGDSEAWIFFPGIEANF